MQYDADYQNEQAESVVFQRHLEQMSNLVVKHFHGDSLLEVGCGKGRFLELLQELGFDINGVDPTYEGSNPAVIKEYFTPALGVRADGIVLRHVLEHVKDPVGFLSNIRDANGGTGKIYIEVPCFDWICAHRSWFDIFYEHVNYFRLSDFSRMFGVVHEAGHAFGGQYLYIVADLATIRSPKCDAADQVEFPPSGEEPQRGSSSLCSCSAQEQRSISSSTLIPLSRASISRQRAFEYMRPKKP